MLQNVDFNISRNYANPCEHSEEILGQSKVSGNEIFLNFVFTEMSHRDISRNVTI